MAVLSTPQAGRKVRQRQHQGKNHQFGVYCAYRRKIAASAEVLRGCQFLIGAQRFFGPSMNTPVLLGAFHPNEQEYFDIVLKTVWSGVRIGRRFAHKNGMLLTLVRLFTIL